jgi:hypothetical protein
MMLLTRLGGLHDDRFLGTMQSNRIAVTRLTAEPEHPDTKNDALQSVYECSATTYDLRAPLSLGIAGAAEG